MKVTTDRTVQLGVMAKLWQPGRVKTRLGRVLGMQPAARLHRAFCRHLAHSLVESADHRCFVVAPPESGPAFRRVLPDGWQLDYQCAGDLGQRIGHWFESPMPEARGRLADRVLIGADCPRITPRTIVESARLLSDHDVVLGPARDGGYYLIALRGDRRDACPVLTGDIPWGTERVLEVTMQRIRQAGLSLAQLKPMSDVDTLDDLQQLRADLERSPDPREQQLLGRIDSVLDGSEYGRQENGGGGIDG